MAGTVRTAAFSADGVLLYASGGDGVVHTWDLRTRRCLGRGADDGCVRSTCLAVSREGSLLATGSGSGVVNVYNAHDVAWPVEGGGGTMPASATSLKPLKSLMNLTTTCDSLAFSHDGAMLAMASRMKRDSLKLLHTASMTVFSNWPTSRTPLGFVHSVDFSPAGGLLAIGNAKGRVLLYRLHHYRET